MKEPKRERHDLIAVFNHVLSTSQIPETVKVAKDVPEDVIFVDVDKEQLCMAFHNIIKNAVEAMNAKGELTLKINKENNAHVKILFTDTGVGIAPENIEKVFQPLFTTKARGMGFGLSICKMIIEKQKGSIAIISQLGKGATVAITLPLG
jgi:signal transduction histidine kinase